MTRPRAAADLATLRDRARGAMLGVALGDALGAPFEGCAMVDAAMFDRHLTGTDPLTWTDDTAMTIALADYLVHVLTVRSTLDEDGLVRTLAAAWSADPGRGYGSGPPPIFTAVVEGRSWREVTGGLFGGRGSFGNGAATRVAPVAITEPTADAVIVTARRSAAVTHTHPTGVGGAAVQALAVHHALNSTERPGASVLVDALLPAADQVLADTLTRLPQLCRRGATPQQAAAVLGNGVAVAESLPVALLAFLTFPDHPVDALAFAVGCGGDTDTIAAMTGALVGARCGARALPSRLLGRLEDARRIGDLADTLVELAVTR